MKKIKEKNEERNDILIYEKITDSKLLSNLSIREEVLLFIKFIKYYIITLSKNGYFEEDVEYIERYLRGELRRKKLENRRNQVLNNLYKLDTYDQSIQDVILIFLDYYVLDGTSQDDDLKNFLTCLFNIDKTLCDVFYNFLIQNINK